MSTVRLDVTQREFKAYNCQKKFIETLANKLKVHKNRIEISKVRDADELEQSVFIDFILSEAENPGDKPLAVLNQ